MRSDGILLDVRSDALELPAISNQMVVALVLPERAWPAQHPIGFVRGKSFQRPQPVTRGHMRRRQQVDVVRHNDEGVQIVPMETDLAVVEGVQNPSRPNAEGGDRGGGP